MENSWQQAALSHPEPKALVWGARSRVTPRGAAAPLRTSPRKLCEVFLGEHAHAHTRTARGGSCAALASPAPPFLAPPERPRCRRGTSASPPPPHPSAPRGSHAPRPRNFAARVREGGSSSAPRPPPAPRWARAVFLTQEKWQILSTSLIWRQNPSFFFFLSISLFFIYLFIF